MSFAHRQPYCHPSTTARRALLDIFRIGQQGITKCQELTWQSICWPSLKAIRTAKSVWKLKKTVTTSTHFNPSTCLVLTESGQWSLWIEPVCPSRRYRLLFEIVRLNWPTTAKVVTHLNGIPETLVSDNGPQYSSREFPIPPSGEWRYRERDIGTIKNLLKRVTILTKLSWLTIWPHSSLCTAPLNS